jgi:restriction endonuclease S subunit
MSKDIAKYKQTSIGLIPKDWEVKRLGDFSDIGTGKKDNQNKVEDGIYPFFVRSQNIERINSYSFDGEAILIPGEGNIGEIFHFINGKFDYHQRVYKISDFKETHGKFIYFSISHFFKKETVKHSVKATVDSLRLPTFTEMLLPIPSCVLEQKKISQILSTWDSGITKTKEIIAELKQRKKGLAQEILLGKIRFSETQNSPLVKNKSYVIPKDWKVAPISKLVKQVKKSVIPEPDTLYSQIGIRSHAKGIFYKEAVTGLSLGNKSVFEIEPDCFIVNIVFAWEHAIAKTTINEVGMIASHRFPMYKPLENELDLDYLLHFFKSKKGKELLGIASPGGAGRNKTLGQSEFLKLQIPVPTLTEQKKIAEFLDKIDTEIIVHQQKLTHLQNQKKGLMQQLLTGKTRVKLND